MAMKKKTAGRGRVTRAAAGKKAAVAKRGARKATPAARKATALRSSAKMTTRQSIGVKARESGGMTVREAGRMGGLIGGKKGGETVKRERGIAFFQLIGRKGGQRVRDLIAAGRKATERPSRRRHT